MLKIAGLMRLTCCFNEASDVPEMAMFTACSS